MYHLAINSLRPNVSSSRSQHGRFQSKLINYVNKVLKETEVVDIENPAGKKLFNAMDAFFCYGLLTADKSYWRCVKQFMPRAEVSMLIAESGDANDRYLSISWLKSAFNKGTLYFQLLSYGNGGHTIIFEKYYHPNACIRNRGLLEAITSLIGQLQGVQFSFYSTRTMRLEPLPAVVVDVPVAPQSINIVEKESLSTDSEAAFEAVPNRVPSEMPPMLAGTIDQDVMLDDLLRNRRNRLNSEIHNQQILEEQEAPPEEVPEPAEPERPDKLEDVIVKSMSLVQMDAISANPLELILAEQLKETEAEEQHAPQLESELNMPQGDVLQLAIYVFDRDSERQLHTFLIMENFYTSPIVLRYLVVTNFSVYILSRLEGKGVPARPTEAENVMTAFQRELRISHEAIKNVKNSMDIFSIILQGNVDDTFTQYVNGVENKEAPAKNSYMFYVGSKEAGERICTAITESILHSSWPKRLHVDYDGFDEYIYSFHPTLEKALNNMKIIGVDIMSLCYWKESSLAEGWVAHDSISGYLYRRCISSMTNWLLKGADIEQKYCVMNGTKMYIFTDSSCKEGDSVIDLSKSECVVPDDKKLENTFNLKCEQGHWQFLCASKSELVRWSQALITASETKCITFDLTPSLAVFIDHHLVFVQEGFRFWTDGFIRVVGKIATNELMTIWHVTKADGDQISLYSGFSAVCFERLAGNVDIIFLRSDSEVERICGLLRTSLDVSVLPVSELTPGKAITKTITAVFRSTVDPWLTVKNAI